MQQNRKGLGYGCAQGYRNAAGDAALTYPRGLALSRSARPGTGSASISRCSRPMPPRSSSACSTMTASASSSASSCPNTPTRSGTATCPTRGPARSTATACTAPTSRRTATASTPTSCCSIPMPRRIVGQLDWNPALFGYKMETRRRPDLRRARQRALHAEMPRGRSGLHLGPRPPRRACRGSARSSTRPHVRGFTMRHPAVPEQLRGTYRRPGRRRRCVDYIRRLGVTAVELLPIHAFVDDSYLLDKGLTNYWGYNTIGFFAPGPALCRATGLRLRRVQGDGGAPARCRASR